MGGGLTKVTVKSVPPLAFQSWVGVGRRTGPEQAPMPSTNLSECSSPACSSPSPPPLQNLTPPKVCTFLTSIPDTPYLLLCSFISFPPQQFSPGSIRPTWVIANSPRACPHATPLAVSDSLAICAFNKLRCEPERCWDCKSDRLTSDPSSSARNMWSNQGCQADRVGAQFLQVPVLTVRPHSPAL